MTYFLVVFDRLNRRVVSIEPFTDADAAVRERFKREIAGSGPGVEVVVLGARSEEELRNTHSRYFGDRSELAAID